MGLPTQQYDLSGLDDLEQKKPDTTAVPQFDLSGLDELETGVAAQPLQSLPTGATTPQPAVTPVVTETESSGGFFDIPHPAVQRLKGFVEAARTPLVPLSKALPPPGAPIVTGVPQLGTVATSEAGKGAVRGVVELAESMTSPENIAIGAVMGGAPAGVKRLGSAAFTALMASQLPDLYEEFQKAETVEDKVRVATHALGTTAFVALAGKHALTKPKVDLRVGGVSQKLQESFGYSKEQADAQASIVDAFADSWEKNTGKSKEDFYQRNLADIVKGGTPAEGALLQEQNRLGLYSKLAQVASEKMLPSMKAESVANHLQKFGVTKDEIKATGLDEFLKENAGKKVTKEQLQQFVDENSVRIEEVTAESQFESYQLPGAKEGSYREVFVTAPFSNIPIKETIRGSFAAVEAELADLKSKYYPNTNVQVPFSQIKRIADLEAYLRQVKEGVGWGDGHGDYSNIKNPIIRVRFNERVDAEGKRTLFIEELQKPSTAEEAKMPTHFRDNAYEIGIKRMIRYAAENGYDRIGWTRGQVQADRYDLSKHVKSVAYTKAGGYLSIKRIDSDSWETMKTGVTPDRLESYVGKEISKRILSEDTDGRVELSGLDLKVGGEGLSRLYDETIPNVFNKLGKKFGTKTVDKGISLGERIAPSVFKGFITEGVKQTSWFKLLTPDEQRYVLELGKIRAAEGNRQGTPLTQINPKIDVAIDLQRKTDLAHEFADQVKSQPFWSSPEPIHSIDITPEMRKSVTEQGFPLFQGKKGSTEFLEDGRAVIRALQNPDFSTGVHEFAHVGRRAIYRMLDEAIPERKAQLQADIEALERWAGVKTGQTWTRPQEELYARAFERYLTEGRAPKPELRGVFERIKEWMLGVYQSIKGTEIDVKLTDSIRDVFDRQLGGKARTVDTAEIVPLRDRAREEAERYGLPQDEETLSALESNIVRQEVGDVLSPPELRPPPVKPSEQLQKPEPYEKAGKLWFLSRKLLRPEFSLGRGISREQSRRPDLEPVAGRLSSRIIDAKLQAGQNFTQHMIEIDKARSGLSEAEQIEATRLAENISKTDLASIAARENAKAVRPKVYQAAETLRKVFDEVKELVRDNKRTMFRARFNPELYKAFTEIIDKGRTIDDVTRQVLDENPNIFPELKTTRGKYNRLASILSEEAGKYEEISNWGIRDYVTKIELGTYRVLDKSGQVRAVGQTRREAQRKFIELRKSNPNLFDADFKKALSTEFHDPVDPLAARKNILLGEKNVFKVMPAYLYGVHNKLMYDPISFEAKDIMKKNPQVFSDNVRGVIEEQLEMFRGKYWLGDRVVDNISHALGLKPRAWSRSTDWLRGKAANLALGFRYAAALVNFVNGQAKAFSAFPREYIDALKSIKTPEAQKFLLEQEKRGALGFSVDIDPSTGKVKPTLPVWKPLGLFVKPEPINRKMTLWAAYQHGLKRGLSPEDAALDARTAVRFIQNAYDLTAVTPLLRAPGFRLAGQFKNFLAGELEFISNMTPTQQARYWTLFYLTVGPVGAIKLARSIPLLGALGLWDDLEEGVKQLPSATLPRGIPGLFDADLSPSATLQLTNEGTIEEQFGYVIAQLSKLRKDVYEPFMSGEEDISDKAIDWAKSLSPMVYYADRVIDSFVTQDGWTLDSKGNKVYQLQNDWERALNISGIPTVGQSELKTSQKILRREQEVAANNIASLNRRIVNRVMKGDQSLQRLGLALLRGIHNNSEAIPDDMYETMVQLLAVDNNLDKEMQQDMLARGINPQSIVEAVRQAQTDPRYREVLRTRLFDRARALELMLE